MWNHNPLDKTHHASTWNAHQQHTSKASTWDVCCTNVKSTSFDPQKNWIWSQHKFQSWIFLPPSLPPSRPLFPSLGTSVMNNLSISPVRSSRLLQSLSIIFCMQQVCCMHEYGKHISQSDLASSVLTASQHKYVNGTGWVSSVSPVHIIANVWQGMQWCIGTIRCIALEKAMAVYFARLAVLLPA